MKRNASLALIEQVIMLLILILAAALCLRAFSWSDKQSLYYKDRDRNAHVLDLYEHIHVFPCNSNGPASLLHFWRTHNGSVIGTYLYERLHNGRR